jgi:hypothetical protein
VRISLDSLPIGYIDTKKQPFYAQGDRTMGDTLAI